MPKTTPLVAARSLAVAGAGVGLCHLLDWPLPWLLGPMFACLAAALTGMRLAAYQTPAIAMRTVLGLAVGLSITPALFGQLSAMAGSLMMVPLFILVIGLVGVPYFRALGFDRVTAFYGAMPGGLQDMLVFGEEAGGDVRAMSLMQVTRLMVVVTVLPLVITWGLGEPMNRPAGAPAATLPLSEAAAMIATAAAGWWVAARIGLFGASILGPMILAAALSLTGVLEHRPPNEAILAAQFLIGMGVGVKYSGITTSELKRVVAASVGYCGILAVISAGFVTAVLTLDLVPPVEAILAFSPGGQAEMAILALVAGADVALVVLHHLVRIVLVILGAPIVAGMMRGRP